MAFWDDLVHYWSTWPNQVVNEFGKVFSNLGGESAKTGWQKWITEQQEREKSWNNGGSFYSNIWNDITGKSNTETANSATAALQEDAQSFNSEEAQKQRDFEAQQADIARQWQEQMSNTAVQRQAADLKAAGFNPWLATNGSGASTGSVGIASGDSASSAQGQAINATKSGAEVLQAVGITAAVMMKMIKLLK